MTNLPDRYEPLLLTFHLPREADGYVLIGNDYGCDLRLMRDGTILAVGPQGNSRTRLVNSSVEKLGQCIDVHREYVRSEAKVIDEPSRRDVIETFAQSIANIDEIAVRDPENWWAVIIEQMRDGFM